MNLKLLRNFFQNEPQYRLKQAHKALFVDLVSDWQEVTVFPTSLRESLNKEFSLNIKTEVYKSKDKSVKVLIELEDGLKIEAVLMRHGKGRNTICLSSQVGCPLGCNFCATGAMGFKRNLSVSEIVDQYLFLARYLKNLEKENNKVGKITNVVFMGMGEPFLNYESVMDAIRIINDKDLIGLGARHISISTAGVVDGIKKLAKENIQVNLAISLHAPDDKLRSELMPINNKYNIKKILLAVDYYIEKTSRRVMFEYLMIKDVNDSTGQAKKLVQLMKMPLHLVNLISYNPTNSKDKFMPSPAINIKKFQDILEKEGVAVTKRHSFGQDIKAACGQLAGK